MVLPLSSSTCMNIGQRLSQLRLSARAYLGCAHLPLQWRVQDLAEGGGGLRPGSRRDGVGVDDIMLLYQVSHFENRCQEAPPVAPFFNSYSPERPQRLFRRISAPHRDKCRTCFKFPFFVGLRDDRPWCFGESFSGMLSPLSDTCPWSLPKSSFCHWYTGTYFVNILVKLLSNVERKRTYGYELRVTLHHCNWILYTVRKCNN